MVANTPAARRDEPIAERRPDPRPRRRLSGPAQALMAGLATATVPGAASAHEAAFQEFTSGNRAAVHLVQAGPTEQPAPPTRVAERGFACLTVASETGPRGAILFAGARGVQMAMVPTEGAGVQPSGPDELNCTTLDGYEAQVRDGMNALAADVATFIRDTGTQMDNPRLNDLAAQLEVDGFSDNLGQAHNQIATAFNLTLNLAREQYGAAVFEHVSEPTANALIIEHQKLAFENRLLDNVTPIVGRIQAQLNAPAEAPTSPQGGDAVIEDIDFDGDAVRQWRGRNAKPVADGPARGMQI